MEENRKTLKVYHGIIMLILSAVCVFFVSPILGANLAKRNTSACTCGRSYCCCQR